MVDGAPGSVDGAADTATEIFLAHRNLLFTVAYELLGSAADAEDVLPVAKLFALSWDRVVAVASFDTALVNGTPALVLRLDGELDSVLSVRIEDGLITGLYAVRNPEKLSRMEREITVSR
ncbi:hypothetical protein [Nocardia cyriacigeorgica]|uniref:hypothetical protein n=1 Tax=Nocardia cyriacigeorgica TaxID=135487 RepID=UPI0020182CB3|nr:hypothetical protein [Nocardia cyriacigeorgica]